MIAATSGIQEVGVSLAFVVFAGILFGLALLGAWLHGVAWHARYHDQEPDENPLSDVATHYVQDETGRPDELAVDPAAHVGGWTPVKPVEQEGTAA